MGDQELTSAAAAEKLQCVLLCGVCLAACSRNDLGPKNF